LDEAELAMPRTKAAEKITPTNESVSTIKTAKVIF
jgi:hypothetical protein